MDFWCGVAMTLLIETAALIAGTAWMERKIREVHTHELENRSS